MLGVLGIGEGDLGFLSFLSSVGDLLIRALFFWVCFSMMRSERLSAGFSVFLDFFSFSSSHAELQAPASVDSIASASVSALGYNKIAYTHTCTSISAYVVLSPLPSMCLHAITQLLNLTDRNFTYVQNLYTIAPHQSTSSHGMTQSAHRHQHQHKRKISPCV